MRPPSRGSDVVGDDRSAQPPTGQVRRDRADPVKFVQQREEEACRVSCPVEQQDRRPGAHLQKMDMIASVQLHVAAAHRSSGQYPLIHLPDFNGIRVSRDRHTLEHLDHPLDLQAARLARVRSEIVLAMYSASLPTP